MPYKENINVEKFRFKYSINIEINQEYFDYINLAKIKYDKM